MDIKTNELKDLSSAYFLKKSARYRAGGYRYAKKLTRDRGDYVSHLFAFLIDISVCLLPVYIWVLEFLLIICGIIPPNFFDALLYIMFGMLFVTSVLALGIFTARSHGQSFGGVMTGLKLVRTDKREAPGINLILRQALGFGIPMIILGYLFQVFGMLFWWALNGVFVLLSNNQQTIFDRIFGLVLVREPDADIPIEVQEEEVEEEPVKEAKPKQPRQWPAFFKRPQAEPKPQTARANVSQKKVILPDSISPIDLHIHSRYSESGYYDVEDLMKQAKDNGLEVISITDHNCARANAAAKRFAKMYDIQYIPGVEIDAQYGNTRVRVLGYYIDWNNAIFDSIEKESLRREKNMSYERVNKFREYSGISIDTDSLMSNSRFQTISAQDITTMVFHNAKVRELPFVKQYLDTSSSELEAKRRFTRAVFGKNGPCYVPASYPNVKDVIDSIHKADGIAILSSWNLDNISDEEIEGMMELGFDGIECFSPRIHPSTMTALLRIVKERHAFVTSGSTYSGPNKPAYQLGKTHCPEKALPLVRIFTKASDGES